MPKMTDDELKALIKQHVESAASYLGGEISTERRKAMDLYNSEPFGNEIAGRSQVVSSDVQDVIESMMPDLIELFASGDNVVEFTPEGREDEEPAQQATDYVAHVWNRDNPGYLNTHDVIKSVLLQKNGVLKIYWEATAKKKKTRLTNVNSLSLQALLADENIEVTRQTKIDVPPAMAEFAPELQPVSADLASVERAMNLS